MATTRKPIAKAASPVTAAPPNSSYLEWGPVWGGTAVAIAISAVLLQFGAGVGLSLGDPVLESGAASWNVVVVGLWTVWVALVSAAAGGYIAGRMRQRWQDGRESEVEIRDGIHGLVVWGVATVAAAVGVAVFSALKAAGMDTSGATGGETPADVLRFEQNISVIFAFATAAGSMLGAGAAWWMATLGGEHRDEGTDVNALVPAMFRRRA